MRLLIHFTILSFILPYPEAFAHKDRIEKPNTYSFTFVDGQTIKLHSSNDSLLAAYSNDIVNGKLKVIKAELMFETGETLIFNGNGEKWERIEIVARKKRVEIPMATTEKISIVHFSTVALFWDGRDDRAFDARYFYISFKIRGDKSFGEYPELQLDFLKNKFFKSTVKGPISKKPMKETDF